MQANTAADAQMATKSDTGLALFRESFKKPSCFSSGTPDLHFALVLGEKIAEKPVNGSAPSSLLDKDSKIKRSVCKIEIPRGNKAAGICSGTEDETKQTDTSADSDPIDSEVVQVPPIWGAPLSGKHFIFECPRPLANGTAAIDPSALALADHSEYAHGAFSSKTFLKGKQTIQASQKTTPNGLTFTTATDKNASTRKPLATSFPLDSPEHPDKLTPVGDKTLLNQGDGIQTPSRHGRIPKVVTGSEANIHMLQGTDPLKTTASPYTTAITETDTSIRMAHHEDTPSSTDKSTNSKSLNGKNSHQKNPRIMSGSSETTTFRNDVISQDNILTDTPHEKLPKGDADQPVHQSVKDKALRRPDHSGILPVAGAADDESNKFQRESSVEDRSADNIGLIKQTTGITVDSVHEQTRLSSVSAGHQLRSSEQDTVALRMDMANMAVPRDNHPTSDVIPATFNMQTVIDHIQNMQQTHGDFSRVRIALDPPNLGAVDLEVVCRREHVEIVMKTESSSVQQALQSRSDDIHTALQRQDLKVETFQVLLQDNGAGQQHAHGGEMYGQHGEQQTRMSVNDDEVIAAAVKPVLLSAEPITGMVSYFA